MGSLPRSLGKSVDALMTDERQIISAIKMGDKNAFEMLYRTHFTGLATFAARYTLSWEEAEEIVQDIFIRLWIERSSLIEDIRSIKSYLYRAVRNAALNRVRHITTITRIHTSSSFSTSAAARPNEEEPADVKLEIEEVRENVKHELSNLPERQRAAIVLRYEHEMTYVDIGRALDISDVAARKLIRKAEERLKASLQQ